MAGFGQTAEAQKAVKIEEVVEPVKVFNGDPFAALRAEESEFKHILKTHQFIGIAGHDGTCKSAIVLDAFVNDKTKQEDAVLPCIDFDGGTGILNSSIYNDERIKTWNPWVMSLIDRTAHDYPATHQRMMDLLKLFIIDAEAGKPIWGVLISGVDSWLEVCNHNMRIVDLGLQRTPFNPQTTVVVAWRKSSHRPHGVCVTHASIKSHD